LPKCYLDWVKQLPEDEKQTLRDSFKTLNVCLAKFLNKPVMCRLMIGILILVNFFFYRGSATWFVDYVSAETESMKKKRESEKVNPLTATGLSYLSQGEKDKLIRDSFSKFNDIFSVIFTNMQ
jgi:hypothetical protein